MASMIENHLSWVLLLWNAKYPDNLIKGYQVKLQIALNTRLPNPILNFCYKFISGRKDMKKAHSIGVHSQDEIIEFGKSDLRVLSDLLCDKPENFGNEPGLLDVVAFANLAQLHFIAKVVEHPLRDVMNDPYPNMAGLVVRVKERAFPDWAEVCAVPEPPAPAPKTPKDKETKEKENKDKDKEATEPADKQPLTDEPEKGKGDEKEKEQEKESEDNPEKDNENEK